VRRQEDYEWVKIVQSVIFGFKIRTKRKKYVAQLGSVGGKSGRLEATKALKS
jgi:hypothetical protein